MVKRFTSCSTGCGFNGNAIWYGDEGSDGGGKDKFCDPFRSGSVVKESFEEKADSFDSLPCKAGLDPPKDDPDGLDE